MDPTQITVMVDARLLALHMAAGTVSHLLLPSCFKELLPKLLLRLAVAAQGDIYKGTADTCCPKISVQVHSLVFSVARGASACSFYHAAPPPPPRGGGGG